MKRLFLIVTLLLSLQVIAQPWITREDTYWFASTGVDLRNATFGGALNDGAYHGTFSIGYRNVGFSIIAYYETFSAIEYESMRINPGFVIRSGKKLFPAGDISLSFIRRPWKNYPSLAFNARMEYLFDRFFVYLRGDYPWRTDYDSYQFSVYGGFSIKFGFS